MPGRVRQYNAAQALYISNQILAARNPYSEPIAVTSQCPDCSSSHRPVRILLPPLRSRDHPHPTKPTHRGLTRR